MRVKLDWLNELVDMSGYTTQEIVDKLSLYSTEIESVDRVLSGTNLVVGHVLTCIDHPDSDHLHITTVDVGDEVLQIVCGAPNIAAGQYVIVAKVGAVLPGDFKIKKAKVRGVESCGMICSLSELGMESKYVPSEYSDGIYYFVKDVKPGDDPLKHLYFNDDILELGLTPNRADMLSMLGVAYEVSAVFERQMKELKYDYVESDELNSDNISVEIATDKCPVYYAKVIKNIKIKKSPDWLISRLIAFGVRPINNAVDITNYILALFGQPLHAFDANLLGNKIVVRNAYENEEFVTLDNIKRTLVSDDVVITNGKEVVALAGVMGGLNTHVTNDTKSIVLEIAAFDSVSVRKTYKRLDLRSEAAIRYEKGVDLNRIKLAMEYACYLFKELCEADILKGDVYAGSTETKDSEIKLTEEYVSNYLGIKVEKEEIKSICERLKFKCTDDLLVSVPSRRRDISIKADMVEEIGRLHGYEYLPETLPYTSSAGSLTKYQKDRRTLRHALVALGLSDAINYSLRENNDTFTYLFEENAKDIELLYPISKERKLLRKNLIPSLLENVSYVFNRKIKNCAFFELGKVYYQIEDKYIEEEHLGFAMSGSLSNTLWQGKNEEIDFFTLKGIVNSVFGKLDVKFEYEMLDEVKEMHPLRTAKIIYNNKKVGFIGMLHPKFAQTNDLQNVYVCEVNLKDILGKEDETKIYTPVSKVPAVERDLAIVLPKGVPAGKLVDEIKKVDKKLISNVLVFDVYEGEKVKEDEKSIALKIVFTSNETLTDEIINGKVNKIIKNIERNLNGYLRA